MGDESAERAVSRWERVFVRAAQRSSRHLEVLSSPHISGPTGQIELDVIVIDARAGILAVEIKAHSRPIPQGFERDQHQVLHQVHSLRDHLAGCGIDVEEAQVGGLIVVASTGPSRPQTPRVPMWTAEDLRDFESAYSGLLDDTGLAEQPLGVELAEQVRAALAHDAPAKAGPRPGSWRLAVHRALRRRPMSTDELLAALQADPDHDGPPPTRWRLQQHLFDAEDYALIVPDAGVPGDNTAARWQLRSAPRGQPARTTSPWDVAELTVPDADRNLTSLRIEGFKAFRDPQHVDLAPLTLFFGENSAGKSSVLQSLMSLAASLLQPGGGPPTFRRESGDARPQAFVGSLYNHDPRRSMTLGLTHPVRRDTPATTYSGPYLPDQRQRSFDFEYALDDPGTWVEVRRTAIAIDALPAIRFLRLYERGGSSGLDLQHLAPGGRAHERQAFTVENTTALRTLLDQLQDPFGWSSEGDLLGGALKDGDDVLFDARAAVPGALLVRYRPTGRSEPPRSAWSAFAVALDRDLMEAVGRIRAIGPIRMPPRVVTLSGGSAPSDVGHDGELTAEFLHANPELEQAVSDWLNRLTGYTLRVARFEDPTPARDLGDALAIVLEDRKGLEVSPANVGFGVSQVLPIATQCLAPDAGTICIEQPEIHVHPRLQSELADLFIESVSSAGNQLLIETHSEHLMLRLQRRIREGTLRSAQLRVYYVEERHDGQGSRILPLELDDDGEFLDAWPRGFFSERLREVL